MSGNDRCEGDSDRPEWDETPVTLALVQEVVEAHPDYRRVSHISQNGHRFTVIEYPNGYGSFLRGAPGAFVEFIEGLEDEITERSTTESDRQEGSQ